jgi:hypothetical protein
MIEVSRSVHGDVDALSSDEAIASASALLCALVDRIDPGRDLERGLDVLTTLRGAFPNLDGPKAVLAERATTFADRALVFVGGRHTSKTHSFARGVFAFIGALIPSLDDPLARLRAAVTAGGAALRHACVSHADGFFRSAIGEIPDLAAARAIAAAASGNIAGSSGGEALDAALCAQVARLVELSIGMPGHPEAGPFYISRGLLMALGRHSWSPSPAASPMRTLASLSTLSLLHALGTDPLPVPRVPGVDANDVLYAGDASYKEELIAAHANGLEAVLAQLEEAAKAGHKDVLLDAVPELFEDKFLRDVLKTDPQGATKPLERAANLLRSVAPNHPILSRANIRAK